MRPKRNAQLRITGRREIVVTIKDIARECNVSFSTVSKALKNSSEISSETKKFIHDKATQMGYHPNLAAHALRTNRTYDIGIIFEDRTGSGFMHQYFATIISGIQKAAQEKGYEITFIGRSRESSFDYLNHARTRNYDGIAILSCDFNSDEIKKLVQSEIPTVTLDYFYDGSHSAIMSDYKTGIRELLEHAIRRGHKKIAMIHGEDTLVTKERMNAFNETCMKNEITIPPEYFEEALYHDPISSEKATKKLMALENPPTCIFYPDDYSAIGGIRELGRRNLVPGKDISIAGYDGIMLASMLNPPLTTYEQNGLEIGTQIAGLLISNIENASSFECKHLLVGGKLIKGGTVARI